MRCGTHRHLTVARLSWVSSPAHFNALLKAELFDIAFSEHFATTRLWFACGILELTKISLMWFDSMIMIKTQHTSARWLRRNLSQQSSSTSVASVTFVIVVKSRCCCLVSLSGGSEKVTWLPAADDVVLVDTVFVAVDCGCGLHVGESCAGDSATAPHQTHTNLQMLFRTV